MGNVSLKWLTLKTDASVKLFDHDADVLQRLTCDSSHWISKLDQCEWAEASLMTASRRDLWLWPSLTSPIISHRLTSNNTHSAATLQHHRLPQSEKDRVFFSALRGLIPDSELLHREMKFFMTLVASQQTAVRPAARLTVFSQCGTLQPARSDECPHSTSTTNCSAPKTLNFKSQTQKTCTSNTIWTLRGL